MAPLGALAADDVSFVVPGPEAGHQLIAPSLVA